eukprot:2370777-Pleurochrysis_carterae.AAC.1
METLLCAAMTRARRVRLPHVAIHTHTRKRTLARSRPARVSGLSGWSLADCLSLPARPCLCLLRWSSIPLRPPCWLLIKYCDTNHYFALLQLLLCPTFAWSSLSPSRFCSDLRTHHCVHLARGCGLSVAARPAPSQHAARHPLFARAAQLRARRRHHPLWARARVRADAPCLQGELHVRRSAFRLAPINPLPLLAA